eukprot:364298-Chlamydomonas_euryale.AAC.11
MLNAKRVLKCAREPGRGIQRACGHVHTTWKACWCVADTHSSPSPAPLHAWNHQHGRSTHAHTHLSNFLACARGPRPRTMILVGHFRKGMKSLIATGLVQGVCTWRMQRICTPQNHLCVFQNCSAAAAHAGLLLSAVANRLNQHPPLLLVLVKVPVAGFSKRNNNA